MDKDFIEKEFNKLLRRMKAKHETIELLGAVFEDVWKKNNLLAEKGEARFENELKELNDRIETLIHQIEHTKSKALISKYERRIEELENNIEERRSSRPVLKDVRDDFGTAFKTIEKFLKSPNSLWNSGVYENQRTLLKLAFTSIVPFDPKTGVGTAGFSLLFEVSELAKTDKSKMVEMPGIEPGSNV